MPTSDASWKGRLRLIGDLERPDHYHLTRDDQCYFLGDYTSGRGFGYSLTNQHIFNLKKGAQLRGTA